MKSLTGLDATFLYLETPEMPMHVGAFNLCELPEGFRGSFHKEMTKHIARRMHLAPVFSRKLVFMPLGLGHPLWVEADSVDIGFHVRRAGSAKKNGEPMTLAEAHKLCAQLHGELIDRNFPLWEFYVFDRIRLPASQGGKVVAGFFSKIHHAALDGKGGVMLANALLDTGPVPRDVPPPGPARPRKLESDLKPGKLIGSVFSSSLGQLIKAARSLPSAASTLGSTLARQSMGSTESGVRGKMPMKLAPKTPFNTGINAGGRVFVTATIPLAECKAMGKSVGGSFNDVVLWLCSTALRNYLESRGNLPKKSLVAAMPVSLREAGATDATHLGNQVSMSLVELGTHLAHPLKRMNAIMASTARVKSSMQSLKRLLPTDYPSLLAPWLVGGAAKMALNAYGKSGMVSRLPMVANLVISNVPGAPVPLYLAGAQFLTFHPLSIIMHGLALNITVQTYAAHVDFGIVADKKALPHAGDLAKAIRAAFAEAQTLFSTASEPSPPHAPPPVKTRKNPVTKAAKKPLLEASPSAKRRSRTDTSASTTNRSKTSNAPVHGKPVRSKVAQKSSAQSRAKTSNSKAVAGPR
jgi:diacylglycerol O-acyltransferase